jgi:DNA-binding response OmpR family regulator
MITSATTKLAPMGESRHAQAEILAVGYDPLLLFSRWAVLEHAGYRVTVSNALDTALALAESRAFNVVVLEHTVPRPHRHAIIDSVRQNRSATVLMVGTSNDHEPRADANVEGLDGPAKLLASVETLLRGRAVPAQRAQALPAAAEGQGEVSSARAST